MKSRPGRGNKTYRSALGDQNSSSYLHLQVNQRQPEGLEQIDQGGAPAPPHVISPHHGCFLVDGRQQRKLKNGDGRTTATNLDADSRSFLNEFPCR